MRCGQPVLLCLRAALRGHQPGGLSNLPRARALAHVEAGHGYGGGPRQRDQPSQVELRHGTVHCCLCFSVSILGLYIELMLPSFQLRVCTEQAKCIFGWHALCVSTMHDRRLLKPAGCWQAVDGPQDRHPGHHSRRRLLHHREPRPLSGSRLPRQGMAVRVLRLPVFLGLVLLVSVVRRA